MADSRLRKPLLTPRLAINDYAHYISQWREGKGFVTSWDNMPMKLLLVHSEVSEAAEDYRHDNREHFAEEIADCFIRLMDITDALGIDIEAEIIAKMEKNKARPYQHGTVQGDVKPTGGTQ